MSPQEQALREQICHIGRLMYQNHYIEGTSGNISARLDENHILITPSGLAKGFMEPDQLIIVDMEGNKVESAIRDAIDRLPTSELPMHLECYQKRPDVNGVVHAHPPTAVALTIVGYDFQRCVIPEMMINLGLVPTTPYATPASPEDRDVISRLLTDHDAILLAHHGSLTVATSVWDAYLKLEMLEHGAYILHLAEQIGGVREIPPYQVDKLLALRDRMGLMRPGDQERFRNAYRDAALETRIRGIVRDVLAERGH